MVSSLSLPEQVTSAPDSERVKSSGEASCCGGGCVRCEGDRGVKQKATLDDGNGGDSSTSNPRYIINA